MGVVLFYLFSGPSRLLIPQHNASWVHVCIVLIGIVGEIKGEMEKEE